MFASERSTLNVISRAVTRDQGAEGGANLGRVRSEELQATGCAPAAVGDRQHRQRDADRIGERHRLALAAADARRAGDDRGENQAAAGHEDEPERQPEHEPAAQIAGSAYG